MSEATATTVEVRNCERCKGEGTTFSKGFTYGEKTYPDKTETCHRCKGAKTFTTPDYVKLFEMVTTGRGMPDGKRKMRTAPDKKWDQYNSIDGARAYYVWRLARFHGGKDVTMPMTATTLLHGDPFYKELDRMSDIVAKRGYGTDMAAAMRWGTALGFVKSQNVPEGLPSTAYEDGPEKID